MVGCHYFLPGLRLPCQPQSITAPRLVPSYTAWWPRHIGVKNLPKVVMQLLPRVGFELTSCWLQVQRYTCCATVPPWVIWCNIMWHCVFGTVTVILLCQCNGHCIMSWLRCVTPDCSAFIANSGHHLHSWASVTNQYKSNVQRELLLCHWEGYCRPGLLLGL